MAIEPVSAAAGGQEAAASQTQIQQIKADQQQQQQQAQNGQQSSTENEPEQGNGSAAAAAAAAVDGLDGQMNGMTLGQSEIELHVACAEGKLDDVRAILSRGLEGLESLDVNTGCTPIVLAIRGNHHDVVRELLSAGAIIPPPGLTNDPLMFSILYPQPMYGMPPQFMGMPPQDFYAPQPPFYPGQPDGRFMPPPPAGPAGPRKDAGALASPNGNHNNLPPAEVSKTIPCRNFPNCKYGASCVFFHPGGPRQFFPAGPAGGPNGSFVPQGYEGGYSGPYPPPGPYFVPQNGQYPNPAFAPEQTPTQASLNPASEIPEQQQQQLQHDQTQTQTAPVPVPAPSQHVPSAIAPVFVPGFQAIPGPADSMTSPPPPSQFGLSPMSPSMLGTSLPSIPPAEAFFAAASPPNGFIPPPPPAGAAAGLNGAPHAHARRQSHGQNFGQQQFGAPGKPFGHGKKPSFSGGPKPWMGRQAAQNGSAKLGGWKDGNPPPCAFYAQGNCRNGEFCKFPHIDAEGNDCRNPDVIRGVIPPVSSIARQSRNMRMMNGGFAAFDPSFRQQQHQQQMQFLQHQRMAAAQAQQAVPANNAATAPTATATATATEGETSTPAETTPATAAQPAPAALPAKPIAASVPNIIRSASQPGVQRVHANGANSRSHSPAPSNVSFHGNGHPRRAGARVPHMNGNIPNRAASAGAGAGPEKKALAAASQRVPRADEFPVLGTPTGEKKEPQWNVGKTAAQVLSAPAPPKPEVKVTAAEEDSSSDKSDKASVTMDSDSESDAVIISTKPSSAAVSGTATPAVPAASSEPKRAPISFASAVSAASIPSLETAPVALKA
ncbi:hypothetical protein I317_04118 [Kwoniella heveanensis CBS 569]|nr:hypothetical protein I317_04118 [Kwoniella heveanensis CBS 569]